MKFLFCRSALWARTIREICRLTTRLQWWWVEGGGGDYREVIRGGIDYRSDVRLGIRRWNKLAFLYLMDKFTGILHHRRSSSHHSCLLFQTRLQTTWSREGITWLLHIKRGSYVFSLIRDVGSYVFSMIRDGYETRTSQVWNIVNCRRIVPLPTREKNRQRRIRWVRWSLISRWLMICMYCP